MKKIIIVATLLLCATSLWAQEEKNPVEVKKLPHLALSNLKSYFPDVQVVEAYTESKKIKDEYTVVLDNTVKVVFDKHGQWSRVYANDGQIPERMVDGRIKMYLGKQGIKGRVVVMCKDKKGNYEVTLDDGTVLKFDSQFKPMH
ncbi:MAG: PepSY-like domain-containing protein [Muribaculaceae bacterium]|nr:PepSY-like domain-containing protein [Muribaculaceae bacterium]